MRKFKRVFGIIKGITIVLFVLFLFPISKLLLWHKKIWIVSEYGYEARDNGYSFFQYIRKQHPEVNCYYAIDFKSSDYGKVKQFGNVVRFGSFRHFVYFCAAKYLISTKTQGFCPSYYLTLFRKKFHLWGKYIFLQHGITYNNQTMLYKKNAKLDLIVCGAKPEYEDIVKNYGYDKKEVVYTGFSRFDSYHNLQPLKQILVMPTWRRYDSDANFIETPFYKMWNELINSDKLDCLLKEHQYLLYFYLHPEFKDKFELFSTKESRIKLLSFNNCDLQKQIRESEIFITDFSSLAFDFGYMKRPVLYFQQDKEFFYSSHYKKGYFDYDKDGFGPVCNDVESIINNLSLLFSGKLPNALLYKNNSYRFFPLNDHNNSNRIFDAINNIKK